VKYVQQLRLKELGFTTDIASLSAYETDMLLAVDFVIAKLRAEEESKKKK
jgi:hypothetical protein